MKTPCTYPFWLLVSMGVVLCGWSEPVAAQSGSRTSYSARSYGTQPPRRINRNLGALDRPTVSPYVGLTTPEGRSAGGYQAFVRPQIQRRQNLSPGTQEILGFNQQEIYQLNTSLTSTGVPTGQQTQLPLQGYITGHPTVFRYFSHYYPALNGR